MSLLCVMMLGDYVYMCHKFLAFYKIWQCDHVKLVPGNGNIDEISLCLSIKVDVFYNISQGLATFFHNSYTLP